MTCAKLIHGVQSKHARPLSAWAIFDNGKFPADYLDIVHKDPLPVFRTKAVARENCLPGEIVRRVEIRHFITKPRAPKHAGAKRPKAR